MSQTKYEIRSSEVQEVMNRPPHFFIRWGNIVIVLIMAFSLFTIDKIQLPIKEHLPVTFEYQQSRDARQVHIIFSLNTSLPARVKAGSKTSVSFAGTALERLGTITGYADSIWSVKGVTYISVNTAGNNGQLSTTTGKIAIPPKGLPVLLDIVTSRMTVFSFLLHSLFKY